jgi:hypothetical protein
MAGNKISGLSHNGITDEYMDPFFYTVYVD